MTRIPLSEYGTTPFEQLIGHNEKVLNNWKILEISIFEDLSLEPELLEQVRRTLAYGSRCEYCMVKAGGPDVVKKNKREELSTAFASLFVVDHKSISNVHFSILKEVFSVKEISELCSFISFISASQKIGSILNLTGDFYSKKA